MHFSIPDTQVEKNGMESFVTFNIYINGTYHCSLRYRQLHKFHLQLKKEFGSHSLFTFPPKRLFMTPSQLEERRSQLEKYIQIASQDSQIVNSETFNNFFLAAQRQAHLDIGIGETFLDVYQLNWQSVKISVRCSEGTNTIQARYAQTIQLRRDFLPYFTLYLVRRFENDYKTVRLLENFESPYLTLYNENEKLSESSSSVTGSTIIIIRKSYWDSAFDEDLFADKVALNIIYLQALHEVEKGYVVADQETRNKLTSLQAKGDKIEYLRVARTLKFYGYIHFEPCYCDYPSPKSCVKICAGNQELCISLINSNEKYSFRVIRIKCWRLTTSNSQHHTDPKIAKGRFELSFEYLVSKGSLNWITVYSSQAVLISSCLQSMVEEMLLKREGKKFRSDGLSIRYNTSPSYSNMNGNVSETTTNESQSSSGDHNRQDTVYKSTTTTIDKPKASGQSDEQPDSKQQYVVENNVFDEIGDDDL